MEIRHLNSLDYVVIIAYMLMVVGVGFYVTRFNKKTSDYFKGGGYIPWGLSMISLFVSGFSAFMFVGAAGFTYKNGGAAIILFSLAFPAYLFGYFLYGRLWRRTRLDTPMEFLYRRYSPGTTYFYTILSVIPNVLTIGIMIYTLCIFVSTALGFNARTFELGVAEVNGFQFVLIVTGIVIIIYTTLGGLWAVMVTDALQFVIILLVSLIMLPVVYNILGDGSILNGFSRLVKDAPPDYFDMALTDRPHSFWVAYSFQLILGYNVNWHIAQRYYSVPDERDTRKMALWCAVMSMVLPMLWIVPVMASPILFPDIASMWPELAEPSEAAFVTLALSVLPHGMLGVMVAAIFAATMSSVDTTFNWIAAVVTKDVYVPIKNRISGTDPSDRVQLYFAKGSVALLGVVAIWIGLSMEKFGGAFDVYLRAFSLYTAPMLVPVILGLIYTRTPWWSGMASFGAGVGVVLIGSAIVNVANGLPVDGFGSIFTDVRTTIVGIDMDRYVINTVFGGLAAAACFFGSALFDKREGAFKERIEAFERDLHTPAHAESEHVDLRGIRSYRLAGRLAVVIGVVLLVLSLPASFLTGSVLNVAAGMLAVSIGVTVELATRRYERRHALAESGEDEAGYA